MFRRGAKLFKRFSKPPGGGRPQAASQWPLIPPPNVEGPLHPRVIQLLFKQNSDRDIDRILVIGR